MERLFLGEAIGPGSTFDLYEKALRKRGRKG
jgi:hypothetical protein